jgi:hypothetical protein
MINTRKMISVASLILAAITLVISADQHPVKAQSQFSHFHGSFRCGRLVEHYSCGKYGPEYNCIPKTRDGKTIYACFHGTN